MMYLMVQKNGQNKNDGCYDLDQAKVILLGKFEMENQIYGITKARRHRQEFGLIGDRISDQNIEEWCRYYGFKLHRIEPSTWSEIADLLEQKKTNRVINFNIEQGVSRI